MFQITHVDLNAKYKHLNRNFNSYCKADYINYNLIVDQIIQMSQSYTNNEKSRSNEEINLSKNKDN